MTKEQLKRRALAAWITIYEAGDSAMDAAVDYSPIYYQFTEEDEFDVEVMVEKLSLAEAKQLVAELENCAADIPLFN